MTSPTVDENPEPGESGYYDWHKAVAKHHNDKAGVGAHHAASRVSVTTSGLAVVSSTDVQAALADLDGRGIDTVDTSPLGGSDGDLVGVDGAGSAKLIDSGTYRKDDRPLVLGAGALEGHFGSPASVTLGNRYAAWALDDGSDEYLGGVVDMPASWSTFDVEVWHSTLTGNAGDARVQIYIRKGASDGETVQSADDAPQVTISAVASAHDLGVDTLASGLAAAAGPTLVGFRRNATDGADTLTGDWLLVAVVLRKAS